MKSALSSIPLLLAAMCGVNAQSLGPAAISAGAARLNNGSLVNIGQPLVGIFSGTAGAATLAVGIIPVTQDSPVLPEPPPLPTIERPTLSGGLFRLTFSSVPGSRYEIQASSNLFDWVSIRTDTATGLSLEFIDTEVSQFDHRFFRLIAK